MAIDAGNLIQSESFPRKSATLRDFAPTYLDSYSFHVTANFPSKDRFSMVMLSFSVAWELSFELCSSAPLEIFSYFNFPAPLASICSTRSREGKNIYIKERQRGVAETC